MTTTSLQFLQGIAEKLPPLEREYAESTEAGCAKVRAAARRLSRDLSQQLQAVTTFPLRRYFVIWGSGDLPLSIELRMECLFIKKVMKGEPAAKRQKQRKDFRKLCLEFLRSPTKFVLIQLIEFVRSRDQIQLLRPTEPIVYLVRLLYQFAAKKGAVAQLLGEEGELSNWDITKWIICFAYRISCKQTARNDQICKFLVVVLHQFIATLSLERARALTDNAQLSSIIRRELASFERVEPTPQLATSIGAIIYDVFIATGHDIFVAKVLFGSGQRTANAIEQAESSTASAVERAELSMAYRFCKRGHPDKQLSFYFLALVIKHCLEHCLGLANLQVIQCLLNWLGGQDEQIEGVLHLSISNSWSRENLGIGKIPTLISTLKLAILLLDTERGRKYFAESPSALPGLIKLVDTVDFPDDHLSPEQDRMQLLELSLLFSRFVTTLSREVSSKTDSLIRNDDLLLLLVQSLIFLETHPHPVPSTQHAKLWKEGRFPLIYFICESLSRRDDPISDLRWVSDLEQFVKDHPEKYKDLFNIPVYLENCRSHGTLLKGKEIKGVVEI